METIPFISISNIKCNETISELVQSYNTTIFIQISTMAGKKISLSISKYDTIERLKKRVYVLEHILIQQQEYIFNGKCLENTNTLNHYNITTKSTIHLNLIFHGIFNEISSTRNWISLNFITKLQIGLHMIQYMRYNLIYMDTLNDFQNELKKCSTDKEINTIFSLIEKYYIE
jgi:hypothetical protein